MSTQHSIEKIAFYGLARSTWTLQREIPAEILRSVSKCFFFSVTKFEWMDAFFRVVKILGVHSFIRNLWISWWPANEIKSRRELWHIPYPEALTDPTVLRPINRTTASAIIRIQFLKNIPKSPPVGPVSYWPRYTDFSKFLTLNHLACKLVIFNCFKINF